MEGVTIFVAGLPTRITKEDLNELFCEYGRIIEIRLPKHEGSTKFAFVEFAERKNAEHAIKV
eukprot:51009-Eustigmatos_ZCMA.PRE.1